MDTPNIRDIQIRTQRYDLEDGLIEIIGGGYLLLIGLVVLGPIVFDALTFMPLNLVVMMLPPLLFGPLLKSLKARFTYPRTGFVAPRPLPNNTKAMILIGGVVLILATAAVSSLLMMAETVNSFFLYSIWAVVFMGLPVALGCAFTAYRYRLSRFWGLAGFTLVSALLSLTFPSVFAWPDGAILLSFAALLASGFLISGIVTFGQYLRHNDHLDAE
ncbi:MAG: hypothetical protein AAGF95_13355 [Chloroflexota bacterium]